MRESDIGGMGLCLVAMLLWFWSMAAMASPLQYKWSPCWSSVNYDLRLSPSRQEWEDLQQSVDHKHSTVLPADAQGCSVHGNPPSGWFPGKPRSSHQLLWPWVSCSLWQSWLGFIACLVLAWTSCWCLPLCGRCLVPAVFQLGVSFPWVCFCYPIWPTTGSLVSIPSWAAALLLKTTKSLSWPFPCVAWTLLFVVLLVVHLRPCLLSQDPLLAFRPLLRLQTAPSRLCLLLLSLCLWFPHLGWNPVPRSLLPSLRALQSGTARAVGWLVPTKQFEVGSVVLGLLASGRVPSLTVVSCRRTVRSLWTCGLATTLLFAAVAWIALWCSVPLVVTGVPLVPSLGLVKTASVIPSPVSARPVPTWCQLDFPSPLSSETSCKDVGRIRHATPDPGEPCSAGSGHRALRFVMARGRAGWIKREQGAGSHASRRRRIACRAGWISSSSSACLGKRRDGYWTSWPFLCSRGPRCGFGWRSEESYWNRSASVGCGLSVNHSGIDAPSSTFRRDSFWIRPRVRVHHARSSVVVRRSSRLDKVFRPRARPCVLLCRRGGRASLAHAKREDTSKVKKSRRWGYAWRRSKADSKTKEAYHRIPISIAGDLDGINPSLEQPDAGHCRSSARFGGSCFGSQFSFLPCTVSSSFQCFAGACFGSIRCRGPDSDPPRTGPAPNPGLLRSPVLEKPQDVLELEKEKQESVEPISNATLAQAVLAQSHALNSLVSQIAQSSSDPLVDLGGLATTGTRGSMGRAKLQNELASQKGLFFQSVMQAMARRMSPTVLVDGSPTELMNRGICGTRYLERFGGYAKHRDLGMIQYQVMSILDFLQTENWTAAPDSAALLSVCLEQAVLDGGRFELAGVLCLQDDLPASIFVNRQAGALSRSRSFAPLADQRWITTALAYLKELDSIQSKRGELSGLKATASDPDRSVAPKANPKKKGGKPSKGGQKGHVENDPDEA